jgi:hypothetical protein
VSMLKARCGGVASAPGPAARAAALRSVVVVDHGVLERLHGGGWMSQVAVFTAWIRETLATTIAWKKNSGRQAPQWRLSTKPYLDTASFHSRSVIRSTVNVIIRQQGSACKFP